MWGADGVPPFFRICYLWIEKGYNIVEVRDPSSTTTFFISNSFICYIPLFYYIIIIIIIKIVLIIHCLPSLLYHWQNGHTRLLLDTSFSLLFLFHLLADLLSILYLASLLYVVLFPLCL